MADPLTPAISDRICKHMNEDHASAIALYAQVFGQQTGRALTKCGIDGKIMPSPWLRS